MYEQYKNELSMYNKEKEDSYHTLDKCYSCGKSKSMEENREDYTVKLLEKKKMQGEKKKKREEKKESQVNTEQSNACFVRGALLYFEPCYIMGVATDEIDFVYDSGTTSGVPGVNETDILFNVEEEHILLEGDRDHKSMSK